MSDLLFAKTTAKARHRSSGAYLVIRGGEGDATWLWDDQTAEVAVGESRHIPQEKT